MVAMQDENSEPSGGIPAFSTVAVAVNGCSRRAVRWAADKLLPTASRFVLVHVMPTVTSIPSPTGSRIPVDGLDESVVTMYKRDLRKEFEQVFVPFKRICKSTKVEILLLEHYDPAKALLQYISDSGVQCLVMGSCSSNFLARKKGQGIPLTVLGEDPDACEIYVVSKDRILTKSSIHFSSSDATSSSRTSEAQEAFSGTHTEKSSFSTSSRASSGRKLFGKLALSQHSYLTSRVFSDTHQSTTVSTVDEHSHPILRHGTTDAGSNKQLKPESFRKAPKSDVKAEVERLRKEVQTTLSSTLVHKQTQVQSLSSECIEEAKRVITALEKEEMLRKATAEEKEKHLKAAKEVEEAKALLAKEFCERQLAELNALRQCIEKQKVIDQLFLSDKRYRKYTKDEISAATDNFSPRKVIGEGGYGKVYKCSLDRTPVAVKVLKPDSVEKKEEFLREVAVLSQLRHPHVVLLLGACPDNGCLVYEYLDNGSLEDYISHKKGKPPLPWFIRFRIIYEVACGMAFLHNSKPEPIVHRDLKPGNILLDRNYVSKIGDVGLAKLISDNAPDSVTVYRNSVLAGTLYYMDPEYQRTGTIRPKSDLYAFGIIILQLLTARHPNGLLFCVEDAVKRGCFPDMLDESVKGWPMDEVEELASIALKCSQLKCRDRPDLETQVLPALKRILESANNRNKNKQDNVRPPSHYYCPILKEIMEDPHIAADGFTYEQKAIKAWIEKHQVSPVTKQRLKHLDLTPNHTLRSAIQEWLSRLERTKST
ncbi:PREDICTED: U-box domain-containing protein 34 [Tarenaya hassleriana]|uniref:U-box domain-containing protein 34 n=1 Tax=Tarenaya hassleriana TaxID=28532 RepID=UPI00053C8E13|nr:PREDICTED: U-box domain-containing protein 34 [Tarenaya hassleriana]